MTAAITTNLPTRPPWREPMLWLVLALPAAVVVAGIATLMIALRAGGSDAIPEQVRRTAQIQVSDLGPDARAKQLALAAVLRVDGEALEALPISGTFAREAPLRLRLQHPTRAAEDRELLLQPTVHGWRAAVAVDPRHDWILQLGPDDGAWRLRGRLPAHTLAAHLGPALAD